MIRIPVVRPLGSRAVCAAALSLLFSALPGISQGEDDADAAARTILQKADEIRFPISGFEVAVRIRSTEGGGAPEVREFKVLSKGNENTIVLTTAPASERGQVLLMKARDLWLFVPNVSQPVRLSLSQRLTGVVSNGDIARANFTGDYNATLLRKEKVDGEGHHVLELTAVDRGVTYHRVLYWVNERNFRPHKAEFYSLSGRLLKTARYEEFKSLGGRVRPTRLVLRDAVRAGEESVMEYSAMKLRDLPARMFSKDYLQRL